MRNLFDNPLLLIVLLLLIVVVFGAKRLPDAARSVGRSMRIFKAEVKEMKDEDKPGSGAPEGSTRGRPIEGRVVGDGPDPVTREDGQHHEQRSERRSGA